MEANRRKLLATATAAVWVIAYVAWTADWMIGPDHHVLQRALRRIPLCLFGAASCWAIGAILHRFASEPVRRRVTLAVALCVCGALVYSLANTVVFYVVSPVWGPTTIGAALQGAMMIVWVFLAWAALYFAIDGILEAGEAKLRLADAQTEALRARNHALAQQVSPHFLFNSLNAVSGLILDGEPGRAERVTLALAGLLRRSLETDSRVFVALGEELDAVHRYVEIEMTRFEERLDVTVSVPDELRSFPVPPLILQPLVENAVRHGVARSVGPVSVRIAATSVGDSLRIVVSDDAAAGGTEAGGGGIGQANVRQRLQLLYGGGASLSCGPLPGRGYSCEIKLPAASNAPA